MKLQEILKICSIIIDKSRINFNTVKFDFEKNRLSATNGQILLRINYNFDEICNKEAFDFFKEKNSIVFNATYLEELIKHLDIGNNLFEVLEKNKKYIAEYFVNVDAISFNKLQSTDKIAYRTKNLLSAIKLCNKLKMENIQFNFSGEKQLTQIKNDIAEIIFMPLDI